MPYQQRKKQGGTIAVVAIVAFLAGRWSEPDKVAPSRLVEQPAAVSASLSAVEETTAIPVATSNTNMTVAQPLTSDGVSQDSREAEHATPASEFVYYRNCSAARAAGAAPIHEGEPGYASRLDRDGDGVACE